MQTGTMENNQTFQSNGFPSSGFHGNESPGTGSPGAGSSGTARAAVNGAAAAWFEVTYLDTSCGLIRSEVFDDAAAADRFANRCVADEDGWAVIDAVRPAKDLAAA